jgi:hypothetical protein
MKGIAWALAIGCLLFGGFLACPDARASRLEARDPAAAPTDPPAEYARPPWGGMCVGLEVLVDGRPLPAVTYAGNTYLSVPGWGTEYEIRVWHRGPRRVEAVVSVDGLSVIKGQPASEEQRGYLVDPYDQIVIKGWRRSRDTVAAFSFEEREKSYAARTGHPENIGVIGLVAFEEAGVNPRPYLEKADAEAPNAGRRSSDVGNTGTGYGRDVDSRVDYVPFTRGPNRRSLTLYYGTADALRRAGVPVPGSFPTPFPRDPEFAPPPPGDPRK